MTNKSPLAQPPWTDRIVVAAFVGPALVLAGVVLYFVATVASALEYRLTAARGAEVGSNAMWSQVWGWGAVGVTVIGLVVAMLALGFAVQVSRRRGYRPPASLQDDPGRAGTPHLGRVGAVTSAGDRASIEPRIRDRLRAASGRLRVRRR